VLQGGAKALLEGGIGGSCRSFEGAACLVGAESELAQAGQDILCLRIHGLRCRYSIPAALLMHETGAEGSLRFVLIVRPAS
jgi:hypothetical protein